MSEIFNFLKKTDAERKKKEVMQEPRLRAPLETASTANAGAETEPEAAETCLAEIEICGDEKFDLTGASPQVRSVLHSLTLVGEQFRLLRSRLDLLQKQKGIKTMLITSTAPGEGKTFTSSCLAGVFAQEGGKRVLLIDADMRKPESGRNFGINGAGLSAGLSSVLRGELEFSRAVLVSSNPEFCFLPSGPVPSNPSELLSSPRLEEILKTAQNHFDWVIVDSPPVLPLADTTVITPLCDAVVLVVRLNSTPAKLVQQAIDQIGREHICGVVLNRQKQARSSRYYYQYYYRSSKGKN